MTGLNAPAATSELGTRDLALAHTSEFKTKAQKFEVEMQ